MKTNRTFQVSCWPDTGNQEHDEVNPVYQNIEVEARHATDAKNLADCEFELGGHRELPRRRRHMITPVESAV